MAKPNTRIYLTIGGKTITATLEDNEAARTLSSRLGNAPITIDMADYGGFEKVGELPWPLPAADFHTTAHPGDIMLYRGRDIVIFYGNNSWDYTPLGKIDNTAASDLRGFLGNGNVRLTISIDESSGIERTRPDDLSGEIVYDLNGNRINHRPLTPGTYIINGKKTIVNGPKCVKR